MRIGATQICFPGKSVAESLAYVKATGYESLELWVQPKGELSPATEETALREMAKQAEREGVAICSLVAGMGGGFASPEAATRLQALQGVRECLRLAKTLGADTVLVNPGGLSPQMRYDVMYANLQAALREIAPQAERARVSVAVENVWNKFLLSPLESKRFLEEIGSEYIAFYFDVGNFVPWAYPEQWIEILGSRIRKVHFKDFHRRDHRFVPLLEGDVDWPAVMKALRGVGYGSDVIQEVTGEEAGMRSTAEAMRKILAM
jgi:hexulose-6-phosphate isomerase